MLKSNLISFLFLLIQSVGLILPATSYAQTKSSQQTVKNTDAAPSEPQLLKSKQALWVAHVLRDKSAKDKIENLNISAIQLPVYLVPQGESFRPLVTLKLNYNKPGWSLFLSDKEPVRKIDENGEHVIYAYLRSRISTILITEVGPNRERKLETIYMFAPEAREYKMVSVFDSVLFTLGHSYLVYRQTSFGTFVSQSLLLGAKYISPEKGYNLGYFADAGLSLYTYTSSPIKENPQFFDARGGISYLVKLFKDPKYRSRFTLGASTINLFSYGSPFGFSGLYGANLGLRTEFYHSAKNSYAGEIQISPYEFGEVLSERSVRFSFDWNRNLNNLRRTQYGLAYTSHRFSSSQEKVNADQLNLYFSLSF